MQRIFNVIISLMVISLGVIVLSDYFKRSDPPNEVDCVVKLEQPEFLLSETPDSALLLEALEYYNVQHPDIVYAQAILETGYFRSKVCKEYNNLFGLYDSKNGDYYRFNHWSESVVGYLNYIQYKFHPPDDYYTFLQGIGYAEDSLYINKLKRLVSSKYE